MAVSVFMLCLQRQIPPLDASFPCFEQRMRLWSEMTKKSPDSWIATGVVKGETDCYRYSLRPPPRSPQALSDLVKGRLSLRRGSGERLLVLPDIWLGIKAVWVFIRDVRHIKYYLHCWY